MYFLINIWRGKGEILWKKGNKKIGLVKIFEVINKFNIKLIKILIFFLTFLAIGIFSISPIIIVIACGIFGIVFGGKYA